MSPARGERVRAAGRVASGGRDWAGALPKGLLLAGLLRGRTVLIGALLLSAGCHPGRAGWGRVRVLASRLEPSSWTVRVDDQGRGADLMVDGSVRPAQCRRTGRGLWCWVSGLRKGYHDLAVQVGGKGVSRRSGLSGPIRPGDQSLLWIVLDRFADGEPGNNIGVHRGDPSGPMGGDLAGLRRHLGFLRDLGATGLLISPVWDHQRRGMDPQGHPAWLAHVPRDPLRLSPAFGDRHELMRLLRSARRKGLRVVLDLPRDGLSLSRYAAVARRWLSRTAADGLRLGPIRAAEGAEWAAWVRGLARDFSPLLLVHRAAPGAQAALAQALAGLPRHARVLERDTGDQWARWLGCGSAGRGFRQESRQGVRRGSWQGPRFRQGRETNPLRGWGRGLVLRVLTTPLRPGPIHRCERGKGSAGAPPASPGRRAQDRYPFPARAASGPPTSTPGQRGQWSSEAQGVDARRAALLLTAHVVASESPVVLYADLVRAEPGKPWPPALGWAGLRRSLRVRQVRRLLRLRRRLAVLRRGRLQAAVQGDLLVVRRSLGRCQVAAVLYRGATARRLPIDLSRLGWRRAGPQRRGAPAASVELVDRLSGEGVTLRGDQVMLDLPPFGAALLVPAEPGVCGG